MLPTDETRRAFLRGLIAASASSLFEPAAAWAATWKLLGTRSVRLIGDVDIVPVTFLAGTFTHLRLRVSGNAIFMNELKVTFSNGETVILPVRFLIPDGGQTRAINLPGIRRFIRFVELRYRSAPNARGRATVEVWGRQ
jgi:hypothetical protein